MKILSTRNLDLTAAENRDNKALIAELILRRSSRRRQEWEVDIPPEFIPFGTLEEYPQGWVGTEVDFDYHGRLVKVQFSGHFIGRDEKGNKVRRTDKYQALWVPEWLLREVKP